MQTQDTAGTTAQQRTILELVTKPQEGMSTVLDVVRELAAEGDDAGSARTRLEIVRRQLQPEQPRDPIREKSQARCHKFYAVAGFIAYLAKFGGKDTVVFADPQEKCIQAVLDENAERGREVVELRPQIHPRWFPWRELHGRKIPMDQLADHVRMNRRTIKGDGRELVFLLSQITCATEVVMQQGKGAEAVNGLMVTTTIRGGGSKTTDPVALPDSITIVSPVWVDQPAIEIELDLVLSAKRDGTEVFAQLASADIKEAEIEAFDVMVEKLRADLPDGYTVTHGAHGQVAWRNVP